MITYSINPNCFNQFQPYQLRILGGDMSSKAQVDNKRWRDRNQFWDAHPHKTPMRYTLRERFGEFQILDKREIIATSESRDNAQRIVDALNESEERE